MNLIPFGRNLIVLTLACLALGACQTNPTVDRSSQSGGNFNLHRQADLGVDLLLSIDGKEKGVVRVADTYRGSLTPGRHVISVLPVPNQYNQAAATATLTVETGKTYSYIAVRQGSLVALVNES